MVPPLGNLERDDRKARFRDEPEAEPERSENEQ
jgi:hypothetical protein